MKADRISPIVAEGKSEHLLPCSCGMDKMTFIDVCREVTVLFLYQFHAYIMQL